MLLCAFMYILACVYVTYPALVISQFPAVLELVGEGQLKFGQLADLALGFLNLTQKVGVLDGELLLGGVEVVEGAVSLVEFGLNLVALVLELLVHLFRGGLAGGWGVSRVPGRGGKERGSILLAKMWHLR